MPDPNQTTLEYGDGSDKVTFDLVSVSFRATTVYDQPGHSPMGTNLNFRCSAHIIGDGMDPRSDFQSKLNKALRTLALPRQTFNWASGGQTIFCIGPANQSGDTGGSSECLADRRYGPHPHVTSVKQIPGGVSAKVDFEIETFVVLCQLIDNPADVEEFWWNFTYSYDRNFNCTRTITGRYRVRSPLNAAGSYLVDSDLWPTIPQNFYRAGQDVRVSADGLQLDFTVRDKQVWRTLPRPLTDGTATFRIDQRMAQLFKTLQCSFEAPMDVDKNVIVQFITALIRARFPDAVNPNLNDERKEWFTSFSVTNHEFLNRVDVTVTAVSYARALLDKNDGGLSLQLIMDVQDVQPDTAFGDEWEASDGFSETRGMTGTAGLIPQTPPLFDVCDDDALDGSDTTEEGVSEEAVSERPDDHQVSEAASQGEDDQTLDSSNPELSEEHETNTYTSYHETWRFINTHNVKVLPNLSKTQPDILQQTTRPQCRVVQVGYATRINEPPVIPQPAVLDEIDSRVDVEEVGTDAPTMLADGVTLVYKARWAYTIVAPTTRQLVDECDVGEPEETCVQYPYNPMFSNQINQQIGQTLVTHREEPVEEDGEYTIDLYA